MRLWCWFCVTLALVGPWHRSALADEPASVAVTLMGSSNELRERFSQVLKAGGAGPVTVALVPPDQADVVVALGAEAFLDALKQPLPVWGVGVPRHLVNQALTEDCRCSASFAETDPARQLALAGRLFPRARKVGLLVSPDSQWQWERVVPEAERRGVLLIAQTAVDQAAVARHLPRLLARVDVLLAVSDPLLFNAASARLILLTSYRQQVPVVGPGEVFVRAGSVVSSYSTLEDFATDTRRALAHWARLRQWASPRFASAFSVRLNQHVAHAYDVPLLDEPQLYQYLVEQP